MRGFNLGILVKHAGSLRHGRDQPPPQPMNQTAVHYVNDSLTKKSSNELQNVVFSQQCVPTKANKCYKCEN